MDFVLETPRLRLRRFAEDLSDLSGMQAVLGDLESMRFYPHPFEIEETRTWIERNLAGYERDGFGLLAIEDRETGEVLGDCGPTIQEVDGEPLVELGWHVLRSRQRQGIATEAALACRDHVFVSSDVPGLVSLIVPENAPSRRVAEKIGMEVWKEAPHGSEARPHLVYRIERGTLDRHGRYSTISTRSKTTSSSGRSWGPTPTFAIDSTIS